MITMKMTIAKAISRMDKMPGKLDAALRPWLVKGARNLVSSSGKYKGLVQATPPFRFDVAGDKSSDAKKRGELAIWRDLFGSGGKRSTGGTRAGLFTPLADGIIAGALESGIYEKSANVRLFVKKNGTVYGTDRAHFKGDAGLAELKGWHKSNFKNGRMSEAGGATRDIGRWKFIDKWVISKSQAEALFAEEKKKVGMLAAAFVQAGDEKFGKLSGVPPWVERHAVFWGRITEIVDNKGRCAFHFKLAAPYAKIDLQRRFDSVLVYRKKAMQREFPHVIRAAAKAEQLQNQG